jgi:hypothetical protein
VELDSRGHEWLQSFSSAALVARNLSWASSSVVVSAELPFQGVITPAHVAMFWLRVQPHLYSIPEFGARDGAIHFGRDDLQLLDPHCSRPVNRYAGSLRDSSETGSRRKVPRRRRGAIPSMCKGPGGDSALREADVARPPGAIDASNLNFSAAGTGQPRVVRSKVAPLC